MSHAAKHTTAAEPAKPKIGIRVDASMDTIKSASKSGHTLKAEYVEAVERAGGQAILIPNFPVSGEGKKSRDLTIQRWLGKIDGLIVPGGDFAFPNDWYISGEGSPYEPTTRLYNDIDIMRPALERDMPILGICAGMQILAGMHDCKLTGNVHTYHDTNTVHRGGEHAIEVTPDSLLERSVGVSAYDVISVHNEAVVEASDKVKVSAMSPDGVIEAVEIPGKRFALGVEWHPECSLSGPDEQLFSSFVDSCRERMQERLKAERK